MFAEQRRRKAAQDKGNGLKREQARRALEVGCGVAALGDEAGQADLSGAIEGGGDGAGAPVIQSTGHVARGLTATTAEVATVQQAARMSPLQQVMRRNRQDKLARHAAGVVRLQTTVGMLHVEVYAGKTPLAAENFLTLCERGAYDGTIFHRCIRHFMIQGGDPTGTGSGGTSVWDEPFPNEVVKKLRHDGRGTISMANKGGTCTNTCQFFIAFDEAPHLDGKYTLFGRVVAGLSVLDKMEATAVDADNRPLTPIKVESVEVVANPFRDLSKTKEERDEAARAMRDKAVREGPMIPGVIRLADVGDSSPVTVWQSGQVPGGDASDVRVGRYVEAIRKTKENGRNMRRREMKTINGLWMSVFRLVHCRNA